MTTNNQLNNEGQTTTSMYVMSLITQNRLCVLQRVAGMFSRYRINIENLNISRHTDELSYWNVVIYTEEDKIKLLLKQLRKVIEMVDVKIIDTVPIAQATKLLLKDTF